MSNSIVQRVKSSSAELNNIEIKALQIACFAVRTVNDLINASSLLRGRLLDKQRLIETRLLHLSGNVT